MGLPPRRYTGSFRVAMPGRAMKQSIGHVALVVRDYDEAIDFYVNRLGFYLLEDTPVEAQNAGMRLSVSAPRWAYNGHRE